VGACISTALNAVPWGKMFKAAKVAINAIGVGKRLAEGHGRLLVGAASAWVGEAGVTTSPGVRALAVAARA